MTTALLEAPANPVVLVTGGTDGIGRASVLDLVKRGAQVVVHGRSKARIDAVVKAAEALRKGSVAGVAEADFASLADVRKMVEKLEKDGLRLDALVNNAGVFMNERRVTGDGFEMTFAVNHLAPFLLTELILRSAVSERLARIVNVASGAHRGGHIDRADLRVERPRFSSHSAYGTSKLANVLVTVELAKRIQDRGIAVNAMHPGVISTKLLTEGFGMHGSDKLEDAATLIALLALGPAAKIGSGRYFSDGKLATASAEGRDEGLARAFYDESEKLVGLA